VAADNAANTERFIVLPCGRGDIFRNTAVFVNKSTGRTVSNTCQFMNVQCSVYKNFGVGCVFRGSVPLSPGNVGGKLLRISVGIKKIMAEIRN
jgi:hypothetical protein